MATAPINARRRRQRRTYNLHGFNVPVLNVTFAKKTNAEHESTDYTLPVPSSETVLIYHDQTIHVTLETLEVGEILGIGDFGRVAAVGIKGKPDIQMAVKYFYLVKDREEGLQSKVDLGMIQSINPHRHPFLITYYGSMIDQTADELLIFMEKMDTSMNRFYQSMHSLAKVTFNELNRLLCRLINNIISALDFLKKYQVLNQNIKPGNILVNKQSVFKLSDFGGPHLFIPRDTVSIGRLQDINHYVSPEATNSDNHCDIHADMWSLGISLVEIITGLYLPNDQLHFPYKSKENWIPPLPSNQTISDEIYNLIRQLLKIDSHERPKTYDEILEISSIRNVSEIPSSEEVAYVTSVIDNISP